ncbi:MAG TPA: hypothetical protein VNF71_10120 [Acidimicrobiales bacterium]|nr:hypothetical protein [Acidimicrobiales bacterium]
MFWVVGVVVAAVVVVLCGVVFVRSWGDGVGGGVPARSPGIWWSLRAGVAGRRLAVALVPLPTRGVPGRCHPRCMEEV